MLASASGTTAPLALSPDLEQDTPHEIMRFIRMVTN